MGSSIASLFGGLISSLTSTGTGDASLSPQQAALAAFQQQEQQFQNNFKFGQTGTGLSTMHTASNAAAGIGGAANAATMFDQNAANNLSVSNANNAATQSALQNLASAAGFNSTSGGSLGTSTGSSGNQGVSS
jgi:hypothetical protein